MFYSTVYSHRVVQPSIPSVLEHFHCLQMRPCIHLESIPIPHLTPPQATTAGPAEELPKFFKFKVIPEPLQAHIPASSTTNPLHETSDPAKLVFSGFPEDSICIPASLALSDHFSAPYSDAPFLRMPLSSSERMLALLWPCHVACGILVPNQGLNLGPGGEGAES